MSLSRLAPATNDQFNFNFIKHTPQKESVKRIELLQWTLTDDQISGFCGGVYHWVRRPEISALLDIFWHGIVSLVLQNSSFEIQNSSFLIQDSSFLIQNSSFSLTEPGTKPTPPEAAQCVSETLKFLILAYCKFRLKWPSLSSVFYRKSAHFNLIKIHSKKTACLFLPSPASMSLRMYTQLDRPLRICPLLYS